MPHGSPILLPFERERIVPTRAPHAGYSEESFHDRTSDRSLDWEVEARNSQGLGF